MDLANRFEFIEIEDPSDDDDDLRVERLLGEPHSPQRRERPPPVTPRAPIRPTIRGYRRARARISPGRARPRALSPSLQPNYWVLHMDRHDETVVPRGIPVEDDELKYYRVPTGVLVGQTTVSLPAEEA
jgi:hypothetical protein